MSDVVPVGIWYENGRVPMKPGYHVLGATSMAKGEVVAIQGTILLVRMREGQFVAGERMIGEAGAHLVIRELTPLERLAAEA